MNRVHTLHSQTICSNPTVSSSFFAQWLHFVFTRNIVSINYWLWNWYNLMQNPTSMASKYESDENQAEPYQICFLLGLKSIYKKQNKTVGWEKLGMVYEMMLHFVFSKSGVFMSLCHCAVPPSGPTWDLFTGQRDRTVTSNKTKLINC